MKMGDRASVRSGIVKEVPTLIYKPLLFPFKSTLSEDEHLAWVRVEAGAGAGAGLRSSD